VGEMLEITGDTLVTVIFTVFDIVPAGLETVTGTDFGSDVYPVF
jgi:hypothetical protein